MAPNPYQIQAAEKWLTRKKIINLISPREFLDFCEANDLGFNDAWTVIKASARAALITDLSMFDAKDAPPEMVAKHFPEDELDLDERRAELTPEQARAIAELAEKMNEEEEDGRPADNPEA